MKGWILGLGSAALAATVLASPTRADGIAVGGRVLVPGGAPLAGADVQLLPWLDELGAARLELRNETREPQARGLTDEQGLFRLAAPHAGLWTVRVEAPGFAASETTLRPLLEPVELAAVTLAPDEGLRVDVRDDRGSPIAGARVVVRPDLSRFPFERDPWTPVRRTSLTGADGSVRIPRGEGEKTEVAAIAAGRAPRLVGGVRGTAARITLPGGVARALEVTSADGRAEAGVLGVVGTAQVPLAFSGDDGGLTLRVPRGEQVELTLLAEDGRRLSATVHGRSVTDEKPRRLTLPVLRAVAGRLIDAESRRAIAGGVVWNAESAETGVVTDRAGGFVLQGPALRPMQITAGAPGFLLGRPVEFRLGDDGRPGPTLALRPAAAIEGRVLDPDGVGVAGAEVEIEVKRSPGMIRIEIGRPVELPRALTDSEGRFRLSPLDPDKSYQVEARAPGFAPANTPAGKLEAYRSKRGVDIELGRGLAVTGTIVDQDGGAVREASVKLEQTRRGRNMGMMRVLEGGAGRMAFEGSSDADGRFAISGVPEGTFDVVVQRRGFAKGGKRGVEIKASAGRSLELGEIVLSPGQSLQGRVRDADGLPVEGVEVFVSEAGGPMMMVMAGPAPAPGSPQPEAVTDAAGWFSLGDLAEGQKYKFSLRRRGFVDRSAGPVEMPHPEPLEVQLDAASDIIGHVRNEAGEPIAGASVNMTRGRTIEMGGSVMKTVMMMSETSDSSGRFAFTDQEPGTVSLSAVAGGYQQAKLDSVQIPKGEDLDDVELSLPGGAILQGRVLAPDGTPAINAAVSEVGEGEAFMRELQAVPSDGNGAYRLEGLAPGKASIEATHPDYPRTVKDVELVVGMNVLDLEFEGGFEVTGRVADTAGQPVAEAVVRLAPAGRMWGGPETTTEPDGTFRMPGVQDGDYRLWVQASGYTASAGEISVQVAGSPLHGLEVQLDPGAAIVGKVIGLEPERFRDVSVRAEGAMFGFGRENVDAEGNYRIDNLSPGSYQVVAAVSQSGKQARGQIAIDPGVEQVTLDLHFGAGLTLSGRAVQGDRAISGATLYAEGLDIEHSGWNQTDQNGEFEIEGLEAGRYRLALRNWQTGLAYDQEIDLATSRELTLEVPTARVGGRVTDAVDRQPLGGVSLTLIRQQSGGDARLPVHTATTDLEGKFEFGNIADGGWTLSGHKKGYAAVSRDVVVLNGRVTEELRLSMDPTEGLTLEARLPTGTPPADVRVAVIDSAGQTLISGVYATGEHGRVRLTSVPPGSWLLVVSAAGSATSTMRVQAPGAPVAVALQPATALRISVPELASSDSVTTVRLHDAGGRPFYALSWTGMPRSEWRMSGGQLEFGSLPPGSWTVTVVSADGRTWQGSSVTTPGSAAELRLE